MAAAVQTCALVIGYHRPPISWSRTHGWRKPLSPNGILPTLSRLFTVEKLPAVWVTGAITDGADRAPFDGHRSGIPLSFVPLSQHLWTAYVQRVCKDALWPVLMSQPQRMRFDPTAWAYYRTVNELFAERIDATASRGATVWLHDYNLWLVAGTLRAARPDLKLGLFHHTPFPPSAMLSALPVADEIRAALACLDWVGFHTRTFAERFRHALAGVARLPRIGVHPLGIDRIAVASLARSRAPFVRQLPGPLVLSVERLDYVKAPLEKVAAIETLLARRPDLHGHLRFRLVCPPPEPGITVYDATKSALEQRISEVNRTYGTAGWQPIEYLPQSLSFTQVIDEYLAADVLWVTSLQDGMNLTAKEFVAAQIAAGRSGVLVLSANAGAAEELGSAALLTDPHSHEDLVDKLAQSLALPYDQRTARLQHLSDLLGHDPPAYWAARIIADIHDH